MTWTHGPSPHVTLSTEWSRIREGKKSMFCVYTVRVLLALSHCLLGAYGCGGDISYGEIGRQYMDFFVIKPGLTFVFRAVSLFPGKLLDTCETISRGKLDHFSKRTNPLLYWAVGSRHSDFLRRKMHPDVGWRVKETSRHHYWLFSPCTLCTVPSLKICCFTQWWHITSFFFSPSL